MKYHRVLSLLEEERAILIWDELWPDTDDQDGRRARQMRMVEIIFQLNESVLEGRFETVPSDTSADMLICSFVSATLIEQ